MQDVVTGIFVPIAGYSTLFTVSNKNDEVTVIREIYNLLALKDYSLNMRQQPAFKILCW
jgi:hypothetical protein